MNLSLQALGIDRMSVAERLDLIAAIWDSLPDNLEALPVPEWHRLELERRRAAAEEDPNAESRT
jgi:putative addiction module component (TIGR02574 family)